MTDFYDQQREREDRIEKASEVLVDNLPQEDMHVKAITSVKNNACECLGRYGMFASYKKGGIVIAIDTYNSLACQYKQEVLDHILNNPHLIIRFPGIRTTEAIELNGCEFTHVIFGESPIDKTFCLVAELYNNFVQRLFKSLI